MVGRTNEDVVVIGNIPLAPRELRILEFLAQGKSNLEIGRLLGLSEKRIESILSEVYGALNVNRRVEAAAWYWDHRGNPGERKTGARHLETAVTPSELMELMEGLINPSPGKVRELKVQGNPQPAMAWANEMSDQLRRTVAQARSSPLLQPLLKSLQRTLALMLLEKDQAFSEIALPHQAWAAARPFVTATEVVAIAKANEDRELAGLAYLRVGAAKYVAEQYAAAVIWLQRAAELVQNTDRQLEIQRALLLALAYLKDWSEAAKAEVSIRQVTDAGNFSDFIAASQAFEGIGRVLGMKRRLEDALDAFDEARRIISSAETPSGSAPLPKVQLAKSKLEALIPWGQTDRKALADGSEGLHLARQHGYHRHAMQIKHLLAHSP